MATEFLLHKRSHLCPFQIFWGHSAPYRHGVSNYRYTRLIFSLGSISEITSYKKPEPRSVGCYRLQTLEIAAFEESKPVQLTSRKVLSWIPDAEIHLRCRNKTLKVFLAPSDDVLAPRQPELHSSLRLYNFVSSIHLEALHDCTARGLNLTGSRLNWKATKVTVI